MSEEGDGPPLAPAAAPADHPVPVVESHALAAVHARGAGYTLGPVALAAVARGALSSLQARTVRRACAALTTRGAFWLGDGPGVGKSRGAGGRRHAAQCHPGAVGDRQRRAARARAARGGGGVGRRRRRHQLARPSLWQGRRGRRVLRVNPSSMAGCVATPTSPCTGPQTRWWRPSRANWTRRPRPNCARRPGRCARRPTTPPSGSAARRAWRAASGGRARTGNARRRPGWPPRRNRRKQTTG